MPFFCVVVFSCFIFGAFIFLSCHPSFCLFVASCVITSFSRHI